MILANAVVVINSLFTAVIHATGNIRGLSLISGTIYLLTVLISFFAFRSGFGPASTYFILFVMTVAVLTVNTILVKCQIPSISLWTMVKELSVPFVAVVISIITTVFLGNLVPNDFWGFVLLFIINTATLSVALCLFWIIPKYGCNIVSFFKNEI
jgi:hypothetical protein